LNAIEFPPDLKEAFQELENAALTFIVSKYYSGAESIYETQFRILTAREMELQANEKYHKGGPLHNLGVSLILQGKLAEGFNKITLAYIEDLLDTKRIEEALGAPAYLALRSYPLIAAEYLERLMELARTRREKNEIPRNPEDLLKEYIYARKDGYADLQASFTVRRPFYVYVIHGRNKQLLESMHTFLSSLGLTPLEWSDAVSLTGKPSPYIGEILDVIFTTAQALIVMMTPDDEGRLREQYREQDEPAYETEYTPQARLNVIFEAGIALGRYPDRTVFVELGNLRPFSDIAGRFIVKLDNSRDKRMDLITRLRNARCNVDLSTSTWEKAGDFQI